MENMLFILLLVAFVKLCLWQNTSQDEKETQIGDIEFLSVAEQLDKVNQIRDKLQTIENLITDITVCRPNECVKYIALKCPTATGEREYNFMVDGENETTEKVLALLYNERKNLRTSLQIETKKLADRCNANCNANNEKSAFLMGGDNFGRYKIL